MREDGLQVLERNRIDLLKSITLGYDYEEEAGHYLLSVDNIIRSGIDYEATNDDLLCLKAATDILKQRLSPNELIQMLEGDEDRFAGLPEVRQAEESRRKKRTLGLGERNLSRLLSQHVTSHPYRKTVIDESGQVIGMEDRITGNHDIGMAHGEWPGAKPDAGEDYSIHHPFHPDVHPLRMNNVVTGRPMYESMLFEKYFGHDETPWWEDGFHEKMAEAPEEESFAKQAMRAENAHEKHHRKKGSPIYDSVDRREGERAFSFFGGPTSNDVDSPYDHMETTRINDYERWKEEEGTDMAALEEKFSGLSEENKERAMQMQHFKDRMDKMSRGGTATTTVYPTEGLSQQEADDLRTRNPEAAEPYSMRHSHSMGWNTLMKGLYFLKPEDRTKVLQHINKHTTDDPERQLVKLSDGKEFPMTRLKKNLEMNTGAEYHWFGRNQKSGPANVPKTIESEDDTKFKGTEGGMATALREAKLYDKLLKELNSVLNKNVEDPNEAIQLGELFAHDDFNHPIVNAHLETSDSPAEGFLAHANRSNQAQLSRDGFLSLAGYDSELNELDEHPTIPGELYEGPLLPKDDVERALKQYDRSVSLGMQSKDIKNAKGFLRSGHAPPRASDLPDGHDDHYIFMDGKRRGLGHLMTKYFGDRGGLGKDPATYNEFLSNYLIFNDPAHPEGKDKTILDNDNVGAYGGLLISPLMSEQSTPLTPAQISTRHGVSKRGVGERPKTRSSHNNYTDDLTTYFPELMASLHDELPTEDTHFQDLKFNRETAADFQQSHPFAGIGSTRGDASLMNRGGAAHRLDFSLSRGSNPANPSDKLVRNFKELYDNPELGPRPDRHPEYLALVGEKKNIDETQEFKNILSEMLEVEARIRQLESGEIPTSNRQAELRILRGDMERLRAAQENIEMGQLDTRKDAYGRFGDDFYEKLDADLRATVTYARTKLLPGILKENPDAFSTLDPVTAMANIMRLAYDASRGLMVDGDHDLSTIGYHEREGTRDSLEQVLQNRGQESPHKELATTLRDNAVVLNPPEDPKNVTEEEIDEAMELLEMPDSDNDAHRLQVEEMLGKLVGPTKAATFGQILRMGEDIAGEDFSEFKDIDRPMREHIGDFENHPYSKDSIPLNMANPEYGAMSALTRLGSPKFRERGDLTTYGLEVHPHPLPPRGKSSRGAFPIQASSKRMKAYYQAMSNGIYTFDEGQSGPLEDASAGGVTKPVHGKMTVPIRPVSSLEGNTVVPAFNSGRMDYGYPMSPTIGHEFMGSQNTPVVGANMPNEQLLNSVSEPWIRALFQDTPEYVDELLSSPGLSQLSALQNNQMRINQNTGEAPVDDFYQVGKMLKAELPKELPLIDPLHRIFEIEDMEQLRGFTGEWVISKYHDGKRVKVKRKGKRIDITDEDGEKVGVDDEIRASLRKVCERDYVIDCTIVGDDLHINDIMLYEETDVTDLTTRERVKLLRGQFESHEPVHVPSPESIRVTDEVGFEDAIKDLGGDGQKLLLRDAKSTYMKGEERHPKWVLLAKAVENIHIPFAMEIDRGHFVIHLPEDLVKYEIVDNEPVNPMAAIGSITKSDYSLRLANSLEPYWRQGFNELLKEKKEFDYLSTNADRADWDENNAKDGMTEERAKRIEHQSGGLLKPKKDKNILLKPKDTLKALLIMEKALEALEKAGSGHYPMSGGRALGIDVGSDIASPRGPTSLTSEHAIPDWDMKERPEEDPEKPSDYPKKPKEKKEKEEQYNDLDA